MTESDQGRRPVARAFRIQEVLVDSAVPLGISALSRLTDLPKSTVARLMVSLTDAGIARRVGASYVAGPRLLTMADRANGSGTEELNRWLLPYLVQLHDLTGLAVAFATLRHGQVQFSDVLYGRTGAEKLAAVPLRVPAERTACGRLLLAYSSPNGLARRLAAQADAGRSDSTALASELWRIRHEGLAYSNGYVAGVPAMAAGLFDRNNGLVGAIGVCGPVDVFNPGEVRTALRSVAGAANTGLRQYPKVPGST